MIIIQVVLNRGENNKKILKKSDGFSTEINFI